MRCAGTPETRLSFVIMFSVPVNRIILMVQKLYHIFYTYVTDPFCMNALENFNTFCRKNYCMVKPMTKCMSSNAGLTASSVKSGREKEEVTGISRLALKARLVKANPVVSYCIWAL